VSRALPEPVTEAGRAGLAAVLAEPSRAVVAVDFDGTLAPIVERPEDARAAVGAVDALAALCRAVAVCAVVTGRAAGDVVALGGLDAVLGLHVLGHYGLEEWVGGQLTSPPPPAGVESARPRVADIVAAADRGVHVEDKGHALVVHTRPAADPASALSRLAGPLHAVAEDNGLEVVRGRFVLELRPPGVDKGLAVRRLTEGQGAAVYIGDDLGDLPAYAAVEQRRANGLPGLTVASVAGADAPGELAARADLVLDGPDAVVAFLTQLAAAL
jgi:trehalose 6-phosphate phosphatase